MQELRVCNIVMSGKLGIVGTIPDKAIKKLSSKGWKTVNEDRCPMLVKKFEGATVCINFHGNVLITSLKKQERGHEVFKEVLEIFRKEKVL